MADETPQKPNAEALAEARLLASGYIDDGQATNFEKEGHTENLAAYLLDRGRKEGRSLSEREKVVYTGTYLISRGIVTPPDSESKPFVVEEDQTSAQLSEVHRRGNLFADLESALRVVSGTGYNAIGEGRRLQTELGLLKGRYSETEEAWRAAEAEVADLQGKKDALTARYNGGLTAEQKAELEARVAENSRQLEAAQAESGRLDAQLKRYTPDGLTNEAAGQLRGQLGEAEKERDRRANKTPVEYDADLAGAERYGDATGYARATEELQPRLEAAQADARTRGERVAALERDLAGVRAELESWEGGLKANGKAELEGSRAQAEAKAERLETELGKLRGEYDADRPHIHRNYDAVVAEREEAKTRAGELADKLAGVRTELETLKLSKKGPLDPTQTEQYRTLEVRARELQTAIERSAGERRTLEENARKLEAEKAEKEAEAARLQRELDAEKAKPSREKTEYRDKEVRIEVEPPDYQGLKALKARLDSGEFVEKSVHEGAVEAGRKAEERAADAERELAGRPDESGLRAEIEGRLRSEYEGRIRETEERAAAAEAAARNAAAAEAAARDAAQKTQGVSVDQLREAFSSIRLEDLK